MTRENPLPKAWSGNESAVLCLLRARLSTSPDDLHSRELLDLWTRCWSTRTFPPPDDFRRSAYEIRRCIAFQIEIPGEIANERRLREVAALVRAAAERRQSAGRYQG